MFAIEMRRCVLGCVPGAILMARDIISTCERRTFPRSDGGKGFGTTESRKRKRKNATFVRRESIRTTFVVDVINYAR